MNSIKLREELVNNKDDYDYLEFSVYGVIEKEIGDILDYIRCYDEDEYIHVYELYEMANSYIYSTCGNAWEKHENLSILARYLIKVLVNSMYFNRSLEISNSIKTSEIVRNIEAKLRNCRK